MLRNAPGTIAPTLVANSRLAGGAAFILSVGLLGGRAYGQQTQISNPNFTEGSGSANDLGGGSWDFNLNDPTTIIDFDTYGIPFGATVTYVYGPGGGGFVVYNNILGADPSFINGTLNGGGGTIYLINPSGVIFGPGAAMLNVGTLFAAAGTMPDPIGSPNVFDVGTGTIQVQALSTISANQAVHLIGANVVNSGTVTAGNLVTMVAATGTVTIFPDSSNPQIFSVSAPGGAAPDPSVGIQNNGVVSVGAGGTIKLGAADIYAAGIVNAAGARIEAADGTVRMNAAGTVIESDGALVAGSALLEADALRASGTISVDDLDLTGDLVATADLTLTGQDGAADSISIGGSVDGATGTTVDVALDAATSTIGGRVGAAGTVDEFSTTGDLVLTIAGDVSLSAISRLDLGGDVTKTEAGALAITGGAVELAGDVTASGGDVAIGGTSITLDGTDAQQIVAGGAGALALNADLTKAEGSLTLTAGGALDATGLLDVVDGSLTATSGGAMTLSGNVAAGTDVDLTSSSTLSANGTIVAGTGSVSATSQGAMTLAADVTGAVDVSLTSAETLSAAGAVVATDGSISIAAGDVLTLASDVTGGEDVAISGSSITLSGTGLQSITATGGSLTITGDLAKADGDLGLSSGTAMTLGDDIDLSNGSLAATAGGTLSLGGDVTVSTDATFTASSIDLKSTDPQTITATSGILTFNGEVTKVEGDASFVAGTAVRLSGDVTVADDLTIDGPAIELTGSDAQTITATTGILTLDGEVTKASGDAAFSAGTDLRITGNLTGAEDVTLTGQTITLDSADPQTIEATAGTLLVNGPMTKAQRDLNLVGAAIDLNDNVTASDGAVSIDSAGLLATSGNITGDDGVTLDAESITLDGGAQSITATNGALTLKASVSKATSGALNLSGTSIVLDEAGDQSITNSAGALRLTGDVVSADGATTLSATGQLEIKDDVTATDDLILTGASIQLSSTDAQTIESTTGSLTVNGSMSKANESLILKAAEAIDVNGGISTDEGAISALAGGAISVSGNLSAKTNVSLDGSAIDLDGNGLQSITATNGSIDLLGAVTKAAGDLVVSAGTSLYVRDEVTVAVGAIDADSGTTMLFEDVVRGNGGVQLSGGTTLELRANVESDAGAISLDATETLTILGDVLASTNVSIDGGSLVLSATDQTIRATTGILEINDDVTKTAGDLTITAGLTARLFGDVTASEDLTITGPSIELASDGDQAIAADSGTLTLTGNVTKATGDLDLSAQALDVNGNVAVTAGSLVATATGSMAFSGNVTAGTDVTLGGVPITLDGTVAQAITATSGTLTLNDDVAKADGNLTLAAGTLLDANGSVDAGGSLTLDSAAIELDGDLTAGAALSIEGDVTLENDSTWTSPGFMLVDGKVDGAHGLTIDTDSTATFLGDLGMTTRLASFTANSGLILFMVDPTDAADTTRTVRADAFSLNQSARVAGAAVDLGANGNLVIETDDFSVSAGRKMTVVGDLSISNGVDGGGNVVASTNVVVGDVNTGGTFTINADTLTIETRLPGTSITAIGPVNPDNGVDFVALGGFDFNFNTLVVTNVGNAPTFATENGSGLFLGQFTMYDTNQSAECLAGLSGGRGLTVADFYSQSGSQFYDVIAKNIIENPVSALAGAIEEFQPLPEATPTSATSDLDALDALDAFGPMFRALRLRGATAAELAALADGGAVLLDLDDGVGMSVSGAPAGAPTSLARIAPGRVAGLLKADAALGMFLDAGAPGFEANREAFRRAALALQRAASEGRPLGDVVREMSAAGDATGTAAARLIGDYVVRGESLGLTAPEGRSVGLAAGVGTAWPQAIVPAKLGITDASDPLFGFDVPAGAFDAGFWSAVDSAAPGR